MPGKLNQIKTGAIISYVQLAISNILPIIYTPVMLNILGKSEYGLYTTAQSVMAFLALLNFGIGGTIVRYITKYIALGDKKEEQKIIGVFTTIYAGISVLVLIVGLTVSFNLHWFFDNLQPQQMETFKVLLILMVLNTAVTLPFSVFSSISVAHERFILNKSLNMLSTVLAPALNLVMLFMGFGSVGLVLAATIINIIMYTAYVFYSVKFLDIKPIFRGIDWSILKGIFAFSAFMFLGEIVNMFYWASDKLMLTSMIGPDTTAVYNIGATFNAYLQTFSVVIIGVLIPRIHKMVTLKATNNDLSDTFIRIGRIQYIIVSFILSAFLIFGEWFIIGFFAGPGYEEAYIVALLGMIPVSIPLIQSVARQIIVAQNKHQFRAIMFAIVAVFKVIATYLVIPHFGMIGAATVTCIGFTIGPVIIMNFYYHFKTGLDIPRFWMNIIKMSWLPVLMACAGFAVNYFLPIQNIYQFLYEAIIFTAVFVVLSYLFMMNRYEKDLFKKPVVKIFRKISKAFSR